MASSKLMALSSLNNRFAVRFGFSLDGLVRCLNTSYCVHSRDVDGARNAIPDIRNLDTATPAERRDNIQKPPLISSIGGHGSGATEAGATSCGLQSHPDKPSRRHGSLRSLSSLGVSTSLRHGDHPLRVSARGVRTLAADIKPGNMVEFKGKLQEVVKTSWTMQGRGGASIQVELRDTNSGTKNVDKWRPDEGLERVILEDREVTYLYDDGNAAVVMDPVTFEQTSIDKALFGAAAMFLKDGMALKVSFHGDSPVAASLPPQVRCTVVDAAATFTGERKTAASKLVTLDGGARIHVPVFVQTGEDVLVRTSDQTFVARAKGD